jgi:very-short-patch-repair endonuclease
MNYEEWCETKSIEYLASKLGASKPEEILGFYLNKVFGDDIEYHKKFKWLKGKSLDFYIETLFLAVEYNGKKAHENRVEPDNEKKSLCEENGVRIVRIMECEIDANIDNVKTEDDIVYYYKHNYSNIDEPIYQLVYYLNKRYNLNEKLDVDIKRDKEEIRSYIKRKLDESKYFEKTIAYKWPEVKDYWSAENEKSIFDVRCSESAGKKDNKTISYKLICPHCGDTYKLNLRKLYNRKSLPQCSCENDAIRMKVNEAIQQYEKQGILIVFYESLESRRIYDYMASRAKYPGIRTFDIEEEMYVKLGFKTILTGHSPQSLL